MQLTSQQIEEVLEHHLRQGNLDFALGVFFAYQQINHIPPELRKWQFYVTEAKLAAIAYQHHKRMFQEKPNEI